MCRTSCGSSASGSMTASPPSCVSSRLLALSMSVADFYVCMYVDEYGSTGLTHRYTEPLAATRWKPPNVRHTRCVGAAERVAAAGLKNPARPCHSHASLCRHGGSYSCFVLLLIFVNWSGVTWMFGGTTCLCQIASMRVSSLVLLGSGSPSVCALVFHNNGWRLTTLNLHEAIHTSR